MKLVSGQEFGLRNTSWVVHGWLQLLCLAILRVWVNGVENDTNHCGGWPKFNETYTENIGEDDS